MNRDINIKKIKNFGYPVNENLPLISFDASKLKTKNEVVNRILCLHNIVGIAINASFELKDDCVKWLKKEDLYDELTTEEKKFIESKDLNDIYKGRQVESIYQFLWAVNIFENIKITDRVPDNLIFQLPSIYTGNKEEFANKCFLRSYEEIYWELDFLYMLDWSLCQVDMLNIKVKKKLFDYQVYYRRKALEWLVNDWDWDNVPMDT